MKPTVKYEKPSVLAELSPERKCVIAASAGTGKTYTLEHLVLDLVLGDACDKCVPLERILVVTFTRRAAAEMTMRVRRLLESVLTAHRTREVVEVDGACWEIDAQAVERIEAALNSFDNAYISTIHGFCQRLLKDYAFDNDQLFDVELVDDSELFEECFYEALRTTIANDPEHCKWLRGWMATGQDLETLYKDLSKIHSRGAFVDGGTDVLPEVPDGHRAYEVVEALARGEQFDKEKIKGDPGWAIRTIARQRFLPAVEEEIERRKQVDGIYTYQDMLQVVHDALERDRNLLDMLQAKFDVALVDEFQDTDPLQWAIFEKVFLADGGDHRLFLIGDEKQSIYGFRGADLNTYRAVVEDVKSAPLRRSWRSTEQLIDAYNTIFTSGFFSNGDVYTPDNCVMPSTTPPVRAQLCGDSAIELLEFDCEPKPNNGFITSAFVEKMTGCIEALLDEPPMLEPGKYLQPGDIYVLTRSNREADKFGDALRRRNIPYAFFRKPGLFKTDEARHVHELLCAIAQPGERSARRRAFIGPFFGVPLEDLEVFDASDTHGYGPREKLESWKAAARRHQFDDLFERILSESGLIRRELLLSSSERRLTNYRHIFEWLTELAATRHLGLEQLADELRAQIEGYADSEEGETDLQRLETDRSSVQIMTIHKSKGLEAEVVFVGGGFSSPYSRSTNKYQRMFTRRSGRVAAYDRSVLTTDGEARRVADELQEEYERVEREEAERLFYVAITRAKAKVFLPYVSEDIREKNDWKINYLLERLDGIAPKVPEDGTYHHISRVRFSADDSSIAKSRDQHIDLDDLADVIELERPRTPRQAFGKRAPTSDSRPFEDIAKDVRVLSSYSQLTTHSSERGDVVADDRAEEILPGGIEAGNCLHEVFEELDYTEVGDFDSAGAWLRAGASASLIDEKLATYGFEPAVYRDHLARLVFDTLNATIAPAHGPAVGRLAELRRERTRREARFVVPIPEQGPKSTVERGYLHGFIDLLFEGADNKIYFADWKSDSRIKGGDFSHASLAAHVSEEYRIQAGVYTMALLRLLGITDQQDYERRVGGFFYFFVRGMRPDRPRSGYYFERPSWAEIGELERRVHDAHLPLGESLHLPLPQSGAQQ